MQKPILDTDSNYMNNSVPMTSIKYKGYRINFTYYFNAKAISCPVLLLGGVLQDMASWKNYVRVFSQTNSVITIDLPGIGTAGVLSSEIGFDFLAECVNKVILKLGLKKINIFSTSYSSIIAYEFSKKYFAKIDKLVITSSMTSIPAKQKKIMLKCIDALEKNNLSNFYNHFINGISNTKQIAENIQLAKKVIQMGVIRMGQKEIAQFIENTKRVLNYKLPKISNIKIPLKPLLFTGELDNFTKPEQCKEIGKYFEDSYFREIPNCDHLFHIGNMNMIISILSPFYESNILPNFCAGRSYRIINKSNLIIQSQLNCLSINAK